jgi:hypothetical protein
MNLAVESIRAYGWSRSDCSLDFPQLMAQQLLSEKPVDGGT